MQSDYAHLDEESGAVDVESVSTIDKKLCEESEQLGTGLSPESAAPGTHARASGTLARDDIKGAIALLPFEWSHEACYAFVREIQIDMYDDPVSCAIYANGQDFVKTHLTPKQLCALSGDDAKLASMLWVQIETVCEWRSAAHAARDAAR
jgi:hypothetical protein